MSNPPSLLDGFQVLKAAYDDSNPGALKARLSNVIVPSDYDYIGYTNTNSTTDTYVYKTGGASGTTVATVTIVYTDSTKAQPSTVTRT